MGFVHAVDRLNEAVGRAAAWLTLVTVIVCAVVVVLRYAFSIGFVWMQELYVWAYACVFMLGAGYTLLHEGHVRVDIFYAEASARTRAIVNLFGAFVFLLPWLALTAWTSIPYVRASWRLGEGSAQSFGMPAVYLLKSVLLVFCLLLGLQGLALAGRSILTLTGRDEPDVVLSEAAGEDESTPTGAI
ncbi:TRAP transporter small permease subunit [Acuticoccus sediminis]|uniref:TRAP transporter small permease subunit n=1 Tax=Acuticoccus sediminis TaxID=2184697 RepID=UPI00192E55AE|nr:TRAP transporter small permease subunit [Acuticoccus sediminis]